MSTSYQKEGIVFSNSEPTQQPWLNINIGNIFFNQGQYNKALERYELSKTYFSQLIPYCLRLEDYLLLTTI